MAATLVSICLLVATAARARAQTRGAELIHQEKAQIPETLWRGHAQGNVILIARIDRSGSVQDARPIWASHKDFVPPTLAAVEAWSFRPAMLDGRPIEIAANIVFPFRIRDNKGKLAGRDLLGPAVSDLAMFPADAAGKKTAPEGFPMRKGIDLRVRVESTVDFPPVDKTRQVPVRVDAISPSRKRFLGYETKIALAPRQTSARLAFSVPLGADWEEGIWLLRFIVDSGDAGGGQFWLARDPSSFDFASALRRLVL